jgi:hypothetical protein
MIQWFKILCFNVLDLARLSKQSWIVRHLIANHIITVEALSYTGWVDFLTRLLSLMHVLLAVLSFYLREWPSFIFKFFFILCLLLIISWIWLIGDFRIYFQRLFYIVRNDFSIVNYQVLDVGILLFSKSSSSCFDRSNTNNLFFVLDDLLHVVLRGAISFQNLDLIGSLVLRSGTCSCSDPSERGLVRVESVLVLLTKVMIFDITMIALSFSGWISTHQCRILMLLQVHMTYEIAINHVDMTADLAWTAIIY